MASGEQRAHAAGQSCPAHYRYGASALAGPPTHVAETAYVVGGLYGNVEALDEILAMRERERQSSGRDVLLVFNGDHNWLNVAPAGFARVNEVVLANVAIRGNVETELATPSDGGCGCNYPDYVNAEYVARSNAVMERLQRTALDFPDIRKALGALPMTRTIMVGGERIGIVHGDAETLSGWSFAAERLSATGRCCSGDEADQALTPVETIERWFREADVTAFLSTHTCLAHARDYVVDGRRRLVANNGAAGLPNFANSSFGLITRVCADAEPATCSLYGATVGGVRFDALPVHYDHARWIGRFIEDWPKGSAAYAAYFNRIVAGPDFDVADAIGGSVAR